jgi:hypothetical protein
MVKGAYWSPDDREAIDVVLQDVLETKPHRSTKKHKTPKEFHGTSKKTLKIAPASDRLLKIAEYFVVLGIDNGYESVAYPPWLSNLLAEKEAKDRLFQKVSTADAEKKEGVVDRTDRLWLKMCDLYWKEYVNEDVKPRRIVFDFLDECWEDLRDYAHSCLRGAYLRKHGKWRNTMDYIDEMSQHSVADREAMRQASNTAYAEKVLNSDDWDAPYLKRSEPGALRAKLERVRQKRNDERRETDDD